MTQALFFFASFRLDLTNERLWREADVVGLRPKTLSLLRYLVEHPQQLVTKKQLLEAIWSETYVSDSALKSCIRELRKVFGDDAKAPTFIETVHRRGYRFVAPISQQPEEDHSQSFSPEPPDPPASFPSLVSVVGREAERDQIESGLAAMLNGQPQVMFISGPAGIGKTALIESFFDTVQLRRAMADHTIWVGRGQCVQHYGAGEPYLPIFEALGRLCRGPQATRLIALLTQYAPSWLLQMPAVLSTSALQALQWQVVGPSQERMLREMADALEAVSNEQPFILVCEDLHWSDAATVELLSTLAQRRGLARLMIIGTYRPSEIMTNAHPLKTAKHELQMHQACTEIRLACLTQDATAAYLKKRFPSVSISIESPEHAWHENPQNGRRPSPALNHWAQLIYDRTEGNPLFLVNVVEALTRDGWLPDSGENRQQQDIEHAIKSIPDNLRLVIEEQCDALPLEAQQILTAGSVAGTNFAVEAVSVALHQTAEEVEEQCHQLVQQGQFLRPEGIREWPNRRVTAQYSFIHALYQEVLYERISAGKRVRLHQQIGQWTEQAYGERSGEIAAELSMHFERGHDPERAVHYHQHAGENAVQRGSHETAIAHFVKGLRLLESLTMSGNTAGLTRLPLQLSSLSPSRFVQYRSADLLAQRVPSHGKSCPWPSGPEALAVERADTRLRLRAVPPGYFHSAGTLLLPGHGQTQEWADVRVLPLNVEPGASSREPGQGSPESIRAKRV